MFTPSPAYLAQEKKAYADLLAAGVTLGTPETLDEHQRASGHTQCAFHLRITATGEDEDGGAASTLLSLLTNGTYGGEPGDYTLIPIAAPVTESEANDG